MSLLSSCSKPSKNLRPNPVDCPTHLLKLRYIAVYQKSWGENNHPLNIRVRSFEQFPPLSCWHYLLAPIWISHVAENLRIMKPNQANSRDSFRRSKLWDFSVAPVAWPRPTEHLHPPGYVKIPLKWSKSENKFTTHLASFASCMCQGAVLVRQDSKESWKKMGRCQCTDATKTCDIRMFTCIPITKRFTCLHDTSQLQYQFVDLARP